MTSEHFEEWFTSKLLPNLQPKSLIVMDNGTYHSMHSEPLLVKSWTKKRMVEWLWANKIDFPPKALKSEILNHIQRQNPTAKYVAHDLASAAGKKFPVIATHQQ